MRNAVVTFDGVEYTMALLGRDADAVAVPDGVLVYLELNMRDGGGKIKNDGKVGQLTSVADSGGYRPVAGVEPKVSAGCWQPREVGKAVAEPAAGKATAKTGRIAGKA